MHRHVERQSVRERGSFADLIAGTRDKPVIRLPVSACWDPAAAQSPVEIDDHSCAGTGKEEADGAVCGRVGTPGAVAAELAHLSILDRNGPASLEEHQGA